MKCAICVIGFNRPEHLERTLTCLFSAMNNFKSNNLEYVILGYLDAVSDSGFHNKSAKGVFDKFGVNATVRERNFGLRRNILSILSEMKSSVYDCFIILEDDINIALSTLHYFDVMFLKYKNNRQVLQISAFSPLISDGELSVFRHGRLATWCWGSWVCKFPTNEEFEIDWKSFEVDKWVAKNSYHLFASPDVVNIVKAQAKGEVQAWSLDLLVYMFSKGLFTIYPSKSFVLNIGHDGSGMNCGRQRLFRNSFKIESIDQIETLNPEEQCNIKLIKEFKQHYAPSLIIRLKKFFSL